VGRDQEEETSHAATVRLLYPVAGYRSTRL
jgi:hypothetical protein